MDLDFDVIVIGGGAAGLFCARTAGYRGRRVAVLEHNPRPGNKILISGGGRCNFTNVGAIAANYVTSGSPHFVKSALARFTPQDFLALVERHGIEWREKKLGQLFCVHSSKQILQLLEAECAEAGVEIRLNCRVNGVQRVDGAGESEARWAIATNQGVYRATSLVIATGGLSFPKLGTTPFGYEVAEQFGVKLVARRPGLVPLTLGSDDLARFGELTGIAFECEVHAGDGTPRFRENLLFTHRGFSGPVALQVSNYWTAGRSIWINVLPGQSAMALLEGHKAGGRDARAALRGLLPDRFIQAWSARHQGARPLAQLPRRELESLAAALESMEVRPAGDEGYLKAEVTLGGVDTAELSSKTLECRRVPGLHFIGEVVDVTGWLGGYNFQWAWSSAHAAGEAV